MAEKPFARAVAQGEADVPRWRADFPFRPGAGYRFDPQAASVAAFAV